MVMSKLHSSCWKAVVYESKSEAFSDFRDLVNGMRVINLCYIIKTCGVLFVFRQKNSCDCFM